MTAPDLTPITAAAAEALREHDVFERRSDLTAVCMCGFDFDPLHFGDPWNDHLATVAVETLTPLIRAQERAKVAAEVRAERQRIDATVIGVAELRAALAERKVERRGWWTR